VSFVATPSVDSTNVLVSLSLAAGALTFRREADQLRADYRVSLTVRRGESTVARLETTQPVRVATIRETARTDESVLFQQLLTLAPGEYRLTLVVRDEGSGKSSNPPEMAVRVPALGSGSLSSPIPFYDAEPRTGRDSLLRLVANPRGTVTYGRDSTIDVYVEAYGGAETSTPLTIQVEGVVVWTGTAAWRDAGNGLLTAIVRVPVASIGLGGATIVAWRSGSADTVRRPVFVTFGDDVPPTTYADLVGQLRYFTSASRLRELEGVSPANRGASWARFYRETDAGAPGTPENEALQRYVGLIRDANARFGEGTIPGWRTDRGMVWLLLGPYDQMTEPVATDLSQRGRLLIWEYRSYNLSVEFVSAGNGQWRLTTASESDVRNTARRLTGAGDGNY
jgi:GWxTD domain-containing protein